MFVDVLVSAQVVYRGTLEVPDFGEQDDLLDAYMEDRLNDPRIVDELDPEEKTIIYTEYEERG